MKTKPTTPIKDEPISIPKAYPSLSQKDREALFDRLKPIRKNAIANAAVLHDRVIKLSYLLESYVEGKVDQTQFGISLDSISRQLVRIDKDITDNSTELDALHESIYPPQKP